MLSGADRRRDVRVPVVNNKREREDSARNGKDGDCICTGIRKRDLATHRRKVSVLRPEVPLEPKNAVSGYQVRHLKRSGREGNQVVRERNCIAQCIQSPYSAQAA